jgi:hypothetical protein
VLDTAYTYENILTRIVNDTTLFSYLKKYKVIDQQAQEYPPSALERLQGITRLIERRENLSLILNTNIGDLITNEFLNNGDLEKETIAFWLGFSSGRCPEEIVHSIFYQVKYGKIKTFFLKNYKSFLPEYDFNEIQNREKLRIFLESFMIEFDKFTEIIDSMYDIVDIDKTPMDKLFYLAQLIGYERDETILFSDTFFREFVKNIIEIYKLKGTNYSYELFMNFLGFNITINEFWFDRRFYFSDASNPETGISNKGDAYFYLTTQKPSDGVIDTSTFKEIITEKDFGKQQNLFNFTHLTTKENVSIEKLLGFDLDWSGDVYTYFKTNIVLYEVERLRTTTSEAAAEVTEAELLAIKKYIDFLTPIFLKQSLRVVMPEEEDRGTDTLSLKDIIENYNKNLIIPWVPFDIEQNVFDDLGQSPCNLQSDGTSGLFINFLNPENIGFPRSMDGLLNNSIYHYGYFPRGSNQRNEFMSFDMQNNIGQNTYKNKTRTIGEMAVLSNNNIHNGTSIHNFRKINESSFSSFSVKDNHIPEKRFFFDGVFCLYEKNINYQAGNPLSSTYGIFIY